MTSSTSRTHAQLSVGPSKAGLSVSFAASLTSRSTRKGQNDEINIAQLHVIKPLIEALKPRIVVLENTSGLANIRRHRPYFNKVLNDIKSAGVGYNLRYRIVNMADHGLPQERKRLLLIAARSVSWLSNNSYGH